MNNEGTFSAALAALKEGQFVRRGAWRDEFVAMMGTHGVSSDLIADERLKSTLAGAGVSVLLDHGNLRRFDIAAETVVNGWLPTAADLMADDWVRYEAAEIAALRLEWELRDAIAGPGVISRDSLAAFIAWQLDQLGIGHAGEYVPSSDTLRLKLMDSPYKDVTIQIKAGGYELHVLGAVYTQGAGRLRLELRDAIGWEEGSKREFHRTLFTFEVLSEGPIPEAWRPASIIHEAEEGEFVGVWETVADCKLGARATVSALYRMGSEPAFFELTDDGEDIEV